MAASPYVALRTFERLVPVWAVLYLLFPGPARDDALPVARGSVNAPHRGEPSTASSLSMLSAPLLDADKAPARLWHTISVGEPVCLGDANTTG